MILVLAILATTVAALSVARPWEDVPPTMRRGQAPAEARSVSIDFGIVTDPETDWSAIDERLDRVGANMVVLGAGRVEFTAFDWSSHPDAAAEPGTDHIARAARALQETEDGAQRDFALLVDAYVPNWIAADPSIAGAEESGYRSTYQASAYQLARGEVGDRLVEYVVALGERYLPAQIAITELFLDHTAGRQDLQLFQEMTGAEDWPRAPDGTVENNADVLRWRAEVITGLLRRMRAGLDEVRDGEGAAIELAMDVRVDWEDDPAAGALASGHDYDVLLRAADRLVVWAYPFDRHSPAEIEGIASALRAAGEDMSRFTMSVGLWAQTSVDDEAISPDTLVRSVRAARTNGITSVNVTPVSLMDDALWRALARAWHPATG
ncbi:hypothetical protein [Nocardioides ochotonae]|uniref:hypothetical protein n=1 Tax=Nocardioides ochotonae TaxID=2685869 RepID=UPI00140BF492|nr:hypothetical protein [Nocardioides ochotonae]